MKFNDTLISGNKCNVSFVLKISASPWGVLTKHSDLQVEGRDFDAQSTWVNYISILL